MCKLQQITHKCNIKPAYVKFVSDSPDEFVGVYTSTKIHKNNNSFLTIPTLSSKNLIFFHILMHLRSRQKENGSKIPPHEINLSVKLFLQPTKLRKISI